MTPQAAARRCSPSLRSAAHSRVAQTYRPDPVRPGRVALRRNRWRTTMQLGNGTTRAYAYDANSRLTTQIELNGSTQLVTIVDSYDAVGNRIGRNLDGVVTTWTYDDLYRLTHQDKTGQVCTYVLDPVGNLEVMWEGGSDPRSFTFDAADRLVTMVEGATLTTFTYTSYGALETEHFRAVRVTNTYDGQDQLIKVERGGVGVPATTSTYTFDGDGMRRTAQEGNVQPTTMVWDGSDYLFLDGPSSDQLVLTLGGEIVASGSKDLLTDPLGSLVREISTGASLSSAFSFAPYGTPLSGTPTIPFRYIAAYGYYFDSSDRDYVRARELEKRLGRWMQTDPIWPRERAYRGVLGSPTTFVDPSGLHSVGLSSTHWYIFPVAPNFANCSSGSVARMKSVCETLGKFGRGQLSAVNDCFMRSASLRGNPHCKPLAEKDRLCLVFGCASLVVSCDTGKCCDPDPPCAYVESRKPCRIHICVSKIGSGRCGDIGNPFENPGNAIDGIVFNMLHELSHCCGVEHGESDEDHQVNRQCNDILACCLDKVLNGRPPNC